MSRPVLIVEDDPDIAEIFSGYEAAYEATKAEALSPGAQNHLYEARAQVALVRAHHILQSLLSMRVSNTVNGVPVPSL